MIVTTFLIFPKNGKDTFIEKIYLYDSKLLDFMVLYMDEFVKKPMHFFVECGA